MSGYKTVKEAFVSHHSGDSIFNVNVISATALVAYALYALATRRYRPSTSLDYATTVLPLLLAVTLFASHPIYLNAILLVLAWLVYPRPRAAPYQNGHAHGAEQQPGKWLDESDSDEEPAEPSKSPTNDISSPRHRLALPSEVVAGITTALSPNSSPLSPLSPPMTASSSADGDSGGSQRQWRRRHTPTPSTHTHTAIDIMPTPDPSGRLHTSHAQHGSETETKMSERERLPFLSVYRAHMMVMTIHCILAVDFPVFPRRMGKCEDFGTSLMDVGVGSFVFSLGLVSVRALDKPSASSRTLSVARALRRALPVLALGVVRLLMVKGSDYPEHVTEYGVHWNFFFTLGILPIFGILLRPLRQRGISWTILGLVTSVLHALILNRGLQAWVLSPVRAGLLGMNKEGIASLAGYLAIYLLGLATGQHVLRSSEQVVVESNVMETADERMQRHQEKRRADLAMELFGYSVCWWFVLGVCRLLRFEVSRRLANLPYVAWVAAYNTSFLLGYLVIEINLFPSPAPRQAVPPLLEAINRNGLAVFLVANLLTGLVNVTIQTMYAPDVSATLVLLSYSIAVCAFAWVARRTTLKI